MRAIRCQSCAGAVAARPGERLPKCLFCGAPATDLVEEEAAEHIEQPEQYAPFAVAKDTADEAFRTFANSSFWYPNDLSAARLELKKLLLPAWAFGGRIELHWTGLVRASNRAGKRPVGNHEIVDIDQVLVPASRSLRLGELRQLGRFDEHALKVFVPDDADAPYELSEMSRSVARERAVGAMEELRRADITNRNQLLTLRTSSILHHIEGRPVLVPIWIGAYRYRNRVYRVLVHGQTGALVGSAPKSLWKMLFVGMGIFFIVAMLAACLLGGGGLAALVGLN